ncbi:MAG: hypothetical protein M1368_10215 [Thaumarchaeota archaeon]|nr:hypothetical protein [Nitrososphaerota archaeon]
MPVGYTNDAAIPSKTSPAILKTFIKGIIGIAVFSLFLDINPSTIVSFLVFVTISIGILGIFVMIKKLTVFEFCDEFIVIRRLFAKPRYVRYNDIVGTSISQGFLAKRMNCGSVFLMLRKGRGNSRMLGGGSAERLEDIPEPQKVCDYFASAGNSGLSAVG